MAAITREYSIAVEPERVFAALTREDEIAGWWTDDLAVRPEVGALAEFRFSRWGAGVLTFEIAELVESEKVRWLTRQGPPQWMGTDVTWQLTPIENGTKVVFSHDGFAQMDGVYETTRENWNYFLASQKAYLETGKGTPGAPLSH